MSSPRILILRTSALGDVVHALPVLVRLRRELPEATIGWVVEQAMAPLLARHPDLDRLITVRLRAWRRRLLAAETWREIGRFLGELADFSPEVVLDLMGNHKAGLLGALTLADRRIGAARGARREPSSAVWISEPVEIEGRHAVDRALEVLGGLLPDDDDQPADFGADKLLAEAPAAAAKLFAEHPEPRLVVHPGAGWENKRYPPGAWGRVAALLGRDPGLPTWVAGGPGEEALVEATVAASNGHASAVEAHGLELLAALHRRAALVLGGDTGPLHLAAALGAPVLCLVGPTDPATNGPYAAPDRALWLELPCSFCHKRLDEPKACLTGIAPETVAERARRLLAGPP